MTSSDGPLISVIVCTYNRHETLQRALTSVLRQDLDDVEVIVIDDGSDAPVALPADQRDRVRLIRTTHRGVGAARAEGLKATRGAFVAYCDDDDEWTPNHLRTLLEYLLEHPDVDLVYADSEWVQGGVAPTIAYSFDHDVFELSGANYIFASDVLHRAHAARDVGGFDASLQALEDWDLWLRMSQAYVLRHLPVVLGRHIWHEGCVSATQHWRDWEQVYRSHQQRVARERVAPHHRPRQGGGRVVPFDRSTWQEGRRELIWHSTLRHTHSFGSVGRQLLLAVERQGVDITMAPFGNQPPPGLERFYTPLDHLGRLAFYCDYRRQPSDLDCARIITLSMWETTFVPQDQVDEINSTAALLYVPCQQNAECYRDCGVHIPIKVLHLGVDPGLFPYLSRRHPDSFTFGSFGDFSPRKGIDVLIRAFQDEFSAREPVRLALKSSGSACIDQMGDPRITLLSGFLHQDSLLEVLRQMDAFVLPSRGEGFGLCGLEAMATGLPLIATNWSGPVEYLDPDDSFPLSYRLVDAQGIEAHGVHFSGLWAEPDYAHLRSLMRWLYEHPQEAAEKGRIAAERVHRSWTWDHIARQMCHDFAAVACR